VQEFVGLVIVPLATLLVTPSTFDPLVVHPDACNEIVVTSATVPLSLREGENVRRPATCVHVTAPVAVLATGVVGPEPEQPAATTVIRMSSRNGNRGACPTDMFRPLGRADLDAIVARIVPTVVEVRPACSGGIVDQTRLEESPEYNAARHRLLDAEIELMRHREGIASLRRQLPMGTAIDDYVFLEGPRRLDDGDDPVTPVRLSELFTQPDRALVLYHLMYGKADTSPCPMCTMWIDGLDGVARHIAQNVDFAIVAAADPTTLRAHARSRGWGHVRLLSCGSNTFKYDLGSEDSAGNQDSTVSVFALDSDGRPHHCYTAHPSMSEDIDQRGIDLLSPVWNILDLTPRGRGDWYAGLDY
jgi:predicted dithiol-disulfide oxidoreductase (DUF899 family)